MWSSDHLIWGATARILEDLFERIVAAGGGDETMALRSAPGLPDA